MFFFPYEVENIVANFPNAKAPVEADLADFELEAVGQLGRLKNEVHYYLGRFFKLLVAQFPFLIFFYKILAYAFFPNWLTTWSPPQSLWK